MGNAKLDIIGQIKQMEQCGVTVLYAVESGSRAWGVESPESDYDVRFIYMRPKEDYLKLSAERDIIEWQLNDRLNINGWDLKKALQQFHTGNPALYEWSNSPVVYKTTPIWEEIYRVAKPYFSEKAAFHYYYDIARDTYEKHLKQKQVKYKKYIYALRPLLACKYIEEKKGIPPVPFETLMYHELSEELITIIDQMLIKKVSTNENTVQPKILRLQRYIEAELTRLSVITRDYQEERELSWEPLDRIFLKVLGV